jgi:hypothetical protein
MEHLDTGKASEPVTVLPTPVAVHSDHQSLPRYSSPHEHKFRLALVLLFIVAAAAVAGAIVFLVNHNKKHSPIAAAEAAKWSSWYPTSTGNDGITEIADHVSSYYLLKPSQPLDAITPISMSESNDAGVTTGLTVVVNAGSSANSTSSSAQNLELLVGKTVAYNICGLGATNCELSGTPSQARELLLQREALELALYTFKYSPSTQNVLAVLPPGHPVTASGTSSTSVTVTVLVVRSELAPLLKKPLDKTLSSYPLDVSELSLWTQTNEAELVDQITSEGLFTSQVESQQEGGSLLVLSPITTS